MYQIKAEATTNVIMTARRGLTRLFWPITRFFGVMASLRHMPIVRPACSTLAVEVTVAAGYLRHCVIVMESSPRRFVMLTGP